MIGNGKIGMTRPEIDAYLRTDGRFAAVASLRHDGAPFVIPMGYYYDGSSLYFSTTRTRGLAKRLRHDPRVTVAVFDHDPIHGYVLVNGNAVEVDDPDNVLSLRMHHRYPKPTVTDQAEHDRIWLSVERVVFRLSTDSAFGMDQRKASDDLQSLAMPDRTAQREPQSELGA